MASSLNTSDATSTTVTLGTASSAGTFSSISNSPSYGPCTHGTYGQCIVCYPSYTPYSTACTCLTYGSICPFHTLQSTGTINVTPWPPLPPSIDLHSKEGHAVTHEMITDDKGLKIVFKCSFCSQIIYKKYIVRIPRKIKEEKCLVRILNHK